MGDRVEVRDGARVEIRQPAPTRVESNSAHAGPGGRSAFQVAQDAGFVGTEDEWLVSLQGASGPPGTPGPTGTPVTREQPLGAVDGVNTTFSAAAAYVAGSTVLYLNGLAQSVPDDYVEVPPTDFDMVEAPIAGDRLLITYTEA